MRVGCCTIRRAAAFTSVFAFASLAFLAVSTAHAVPIAYSFSTGVKNDTASFLFPSSALDGLSVSGTFTYDADVTAAGSGPNVYSGAVTNFSGTIDGFSFFDPNGIAQVMNDTHAPVRRPPLLAPPPGDLLQLASSEPTDDDDLTGFTLPVPSGGYELSLLRARMFWIETLPLPEGGSYMPSAQPTGDFLTSAGLPAALPSFAGRLALDFAAQPESGFPFSIAFFDDLIVTPVSVPEPGTLALLAAAVPVLVPLRRRAAARART